MTQPDSAWGRNAPVISGVSVFGLALVVPSAMAWLLSSAPFTLGLPQCAAALLLGTGAFVLARVQHTQTQVRILGAVRSLDLGGQQFKAGASDALALLEAAAQAASKELKHQTGLAQGILSGLPVPFLLVDGQERAVSSNQDCLRMLELDGRPEDYYGQTLAQIFYNDPSRKTAVGKSINGGEVFRNLEVAIKGHRGGVRHVLANVFPLYDSDRRCLGGLCLYLDMTDLKQKEQDILCKNQGIEHTALEADALCQRLRDASGSLSKSIGHTANGSEAQKARTDEISASMGEMSVAVVDVAKNAAVASTGAEDARRLAEQGAQAVQNVIGAIRSVAEHTQSMQGRLAELDGQVTGIGQILGVINDIADQTNLLALNAAIEAARAGDAGRGFAVVADEVRKLAEKTMTATKEVAQAITSVQQGARRVAEGMSGATQAVEKSTGLADGAGKSLQEILRISQGSEDQVRSIAAAAEEQSASAEEISRAVAQMRGVSEQTAQDMVQAERAVRELAQLAEDLKQLITKMQAC